MRGALGRGRGERHSWRGGRSGRLEERGEVRGGRFVDGFLGEQFALPAAVESLRATRQLPHGGELTTVSAADPLNLVGIIVPGDRTPAILLQLEKEALIVECSRYSNEFGR